MRNRFKLLAAALLLLPIIQACGGDIPPPPPTGSIDGLVSIEDQGADGISVTLSNGTTATTANGGMYRFDDLEAGAYTVTISNFPDEASFDQTSAPATIATDGETVTVNFSGTYIRTSSIMGTVTVENDGLSGITVRLSGVSDSETLTDASGQYAFTGLRAGNYTVEITGFDDEDVAFGSTSSAAAVAVGESKVVSFEGTYLRTSGVMGQITADDQPQEGITVSLQGRGEDRAVTTNSAGQYSFDALRRGDYSVGISGYDTDEVSFDETSQSVTVAYGETANVPFEGTLLRTAGIEGTVSVEGVGPISGVTVTISGEGESADDVTDNAGVYSFEGLPAGDYSVVISGFDDDEYGFPDGTSATVTVELQSTGTVPFEGIMLRTAAIEGTVTVGDNDAPLRGVTVTIEGGPKDEEHETTTNGSGRYQVDRLHAGDYSVSISGYDTREYGFDPTTKRLTVGLRDTGEAAFQGDLLRTAGISGRVRVGDMGLAGVTVTLTGEESREGNTDADGQYNFSGLAAGDYTLTISGWDEVEYAFEPTMDITVELDESKNGVDFEGRALRTATVMGSVTVEGAGLPGIAVTLIKVESANSGTVIGTMATGSDGGYTFGPLLAGAYQVMIAGYADEHDFGEAGTTRTTVVAVDGMAMVDFPATIIRTAGVSGMVTLDGEGMADIAVTLTGDHAPDDNSMTTGADGAYSFGGLRKGNYTVTMTNPDEGKYSFPTTSRSMNLSVGQKQTGISFAGASLRRASISGQVHAEGDGVPGVTVTLSGKEDGTATTDDNGEYNFPGLAGGTYTVEISGWDEDAYEFPSDATTKVVKLGDDEAAIEDFTGTHTRTAVISGMLFLDEVNTDGKHTDGEPMLDLSAEIAALVKAEVIPAAVTGLPLMLRGPGLDDEQPGMANADGTYSFPGLRAGDYRVGVAIGLKVNDDGLTVGDLLTGAGYRYGGENTEIPVSVEAAEKATDVNFPFEITMQTIAVGAVMGNDSVATEVAVKGVKLAMYPTVQDADDGTRMLGEATTDSAGMAKFDFARAKDLGAGRHGTDHLVFVKVKGTPTDLEVSDNSHIEIAYASTRRNDNAPTAVRLLNTRANFQWWVKSKEGAVNGDRFLPHWEITMGDDTVPIMTDKDGKASYSASVKVADLPMKFSVSVDTVQADSVDGGEMWKQSNALTHTHDGLSLPADNEAKDNDLGAIRVTWTTQSLVVGVYREQDDTEGYLPQAAQRDEDDHRPSARTAAEMDIEVQKRVGRRWEKYEWYDHDDDPKTDPIHPDLSFKDGLVTARHLPATEELAVEINLGQNRKLVTGLRYVETFGDDLDDGMTYGSFGEGGGGVPAVRLCTASVGTSHKDEDCATFGYQWMTGTVSGNVGSVRGLDVAIEPVTENHDADDGDTKTGTGGAYSFSGLQDGTYDVTASGNADWSIVGDETQKVWIYHDEFADEKGEDKADSAWVGSRGHADATWKLTQEGLEIRGYVANVDHEYNRVVRGDETFAGAVLEIHAAGTGTIKNGIPPKGKKLDQTATVQDDGSYKFVDLPAGRYVITAVNTDDYEALQSNPADNVAGPATADDDYVDVDEQNETLALPSWDYVNSTAMNITDAVTVGTGTSAKSFTFHNFALLHKDGTFSGSVKEASGRPGAVAVELRRCLVYTAPAPDATPPIEETCSDDPDFRPQVKQTTTSGSWSFPGLREGYYQVNIAATGYNRAKWDSDGINDDAANCEGGTEADTDACDTQRTMRKFDLLKGKTAFNRDRAVYYIYNGNLRSADEMTAVAVTGVTAVGAEAAAIDGALATLTSPNDGTTTDLGATDAAVTYRAESITVKATVSGGATYVVMRGSGATAKTYSPSTLTGATVPLLANPTPADGGADVNATTALDNDITVMVTGENGYNDHAYTFTATRANPAGNVLEDSEITPSPGAGDGSNATPWVITTTSGTTQNVTVRFDLISLGAGSASGYCVQSVEVYNADGSKRAKATDTDADLCPGEFYSLSAGAVGGGGLYYRVEMKSEDGKTNDYTILVQRGT